MATRILLVISVGLLASCDYLESYLADDKVASQENANLPYSDYQQVVVEARNIRVAVEAAGEVEPVTTVEVKSKASGEILEMTVDTGDVVETGTLLAQIDQRVLKNTLKQREGELKAIKTTVFSANKDKFASIKKTNGLKRRVKELGGDVSDYEAEGEDVGNVQARASAGYPSSRGAKSGIDAGEAHDGSDAKPSVSE